MKGLELCERFYKEFGAPMISEQFPELERYIAVGLIGSGSECYGFDDEISHDHDFGPGFCMFIPELEVFDSKTLFRLERAYSKLPHEFMGYTRKELNPLGGNRHGVILLSRFLEEKLGRSDGLPQGCEWFSLPEQALLEATSGKVFRDDFGLLSSTREALAYLPPEIRLKKLAGNLLLMGQAGQYNYSRSANRGDTAAAQLAAIEFAKHAIAAIFLLNRAYLPYYKWTFRALKGLPRLSELAGALEHIISSDNHNPAQKQEEIDSVCAAVIAEVKAQGLSLLDSSVAEQHAFAVNDKISDPNLRNLHILCGV